MKQESFSLIDFPLGEKNGVFWRTNERAEAGLDVGGNVQTLLPQMFAPNSKKPAKFWNLVLILWIAQNDIEEFEVLLRVR